MFSVHSSFGFFSSFSANLRHKCLRWVDGLASESESQSTIVINELRDELMSFQKSGCGSKHELYKALEIILVGALGHHHEYARESAVVLLNVLYDGHDLQLRESLAVAIATVGEAPVVTTTIFDEVENSENSSITLKLYGPTLQGKKTVLKWTDHDVTVSKNGVVTFRLPPFPRTGFYDWMLALNEGRWDALDRKRARGRFIVHPKSFRESKIIEVPVDEAGAIWDESTGKLQTRGSFKEVIPLLDKFRDSGVTAVYLMGALERPHDDALNFPFVVADRSSPATTLGGEKAFSHLLKKINDAGMISIVDVIDRVSATRAHRKYGGMYVGTLSKRDKMVGIAHPGTDCHENEWEETSLFNFRNVATWYLMISEVKHLVREYGIGGIRFDNAQSVPAILAPDLEELFRRDTDGEYHYSAEDRLFGSFVKTNIESGYWSTEAAMYSGYSNPFLVKFAREMWSLEQNFVLVAESHFLREAQLLQSGFIAHTVRIPQILASINGKSLRCNGTTAKLSMKKRSTPATLSRLLKHDRIAFPKSPIMINCTCTHLSPYPGAIYGKRTWLAVDLLFFMPSVPMLLHGEKQGKSHRINMAPASEKEEDSSHDIHYDEVLPRSPKRLTPISSLGDLSAPSLSPIVHSKPTKSVAATPPNGIGNDEYNRDPVLPSQSKGLSANPTKRKGLRRSPSFLGAKKVSKTSMVRCQSREDMQGMSVRSVSAADLRKINDLAEQTRMEIGPSFGFDLTQIHAHYEHRERLRQQNEVLRTGEFCVLTPDPQMRTQVFAFARFSKTDILIFAANFRDWRDGEEHAAGCDTELDLEILWDRLDYNMISQHDKLFFFADFLSDQVHESSEFFTLEELVFRKLSVHIAPLGVSALKLVSWESNDMKSLRAEHYTQCLRRLQEVDASDRITDARENFVISSITRGASKSLESFALAADRARKGLAIDGCPRDTVRQVLKLCLQRASSLRMNVLYDGKCRPLDFDPPRAERIVSYLSLLATAAKDEDLRTLTQEIISGSPNIGPLVFLSAELGRFSTAGGLGVMVDELTKGLAKLGLEVYVVSPYYAVNRKDRTDYLGDHITWKRNILVDVNPLLEVGVFEGKEDGVNLIFLERKDYFTKVYADPGHATKHVQCICLLSLGALEVFCQKKIRPAMVVTNDWLPALAAAYARNGHFGSFFDDTSFFHIIHNLGDIMYEGRVFPHKEGDDLTYIHRLPPHLLIDPWWARVMINPTRAALLCSTSWGTVSQSYLKELKASHPLAPLLDIAKAPFAFPNGIPIAERKAKLMSRGARNHADAKLLLQKRYFPSVQPDVNVPLMSFVGRITSQKGVHMILNAVEEIVHHTTGKIQILCGGPANYEDSYSSWCASRMRELCNRFPSSFWANPDEFFTDGPLVNLGSDFGLMPSFFEPGGIVQQEFFVGGTPVIAHRTGGLKDTVHEWDYEQGEGNGFVHEHYTHASFVSAIKRALRVFAVPSEYGMLRSSAYNTTIDVSQVAWAWCSEFHRIRNAIYSRPDLASKDFAQLLAEEAAALESSVIEKGTRIVKITWNGSEEYSQNIAVMGSWDSWSRRWVLCNQEEGDAMEVKLVIRPGKYHYKYLVDDEWKLADDKETEEDEQGLENHVLIV